MEISIRNMLQALNAMRRAAGRLDRSHDLRRAIVGDLGWRNLRHTVRLVEAFRTGRHISNNINATNDTDTSNTTNIHKHTTHTYYYYYYYYY